MNDPKDCELLLFEKSREQEIIVSRCMRRNKNIEDIYSTCSNCPNFRDSSKDFLLTEEDE
ncbi:MAG: hypothetical protein KBF99_09375 [Leptospiraceae bacterium]|nr:hypothetical protein [Leptospiraceae bacterium]MBK7054183.1 hypothetical protein [Leptospiraceae bacterium]MBK9499691.1 hypothetical protein [Leptospiraceae bacterium]MBL0262352.1 hypothetical protein [Leptospiraceae bacterium]MBP9163383.1 hypothetical protein [Leptospiraceae bacterium]